MDRQNVAEQNYPFLPLRRIEKAACLGNLHINTLYFGAANFILKFPKLLLLI